MPKKFIRLPSIESFKKILIRIRSFRMLLNQLLIIAWMDTMEPSLLIDRLDQERLLLWAGVMIGKNEGSFLEFSAMSLNSSERDPRNIHTNFIFPSSRYIMRTLMIYYKKSTPKTTLSNGLRYNIYDLDCVYGGWRIESPDEERWHSLREERTRGSQFPYDGQLYTQD